MEISIAGRIVIGSAVVCLLASACPMTSRASGLPPWFLCTMGREAAQLGFEQSLSPSNGAAVPVGTAITFSGESTNPVTFSIASSPALLSNPDIDGGAGSAQPGQTSSSAVYTFVSTKAAAVPRTVYWQASFSTSDIPECEGQKTVSTEARALTVLPPTPPPAMQIETHPPAATRSPLRVSIRKPIGFSVADPRVAYRISCSAACSGETSYAVFVTRAKTGARKVAQLSVHARHISLRASDGGEALVFWPYRGSALRTLKHIVRDRATVEVHFIATITGSSGETVVSRRRLRWRV